MQPAFFVVTNLYLPGPICRVRRQTQRVTEGWQSQGENVAEKKWLSSNPDGNLRVTGNPPPISGLSRGWWWWILTFNSLRMYFFQSNWYSEPEPPKSLGPFFVQIGNKWHFIFKTRWWFQIFFMFTPILGEMIQFHEHILANGLVQPPTRINLVVEIIDFTVISHRTFLDSFACFLLKKAKASYLIYFRWSWLKHHLGRR